MADPHNPVEENQFNLIHETDDNDVVDTEETGSETEEEESGEQEYTPIVNSPRVSGNSDGDSVEGGRSKRRRLEETSIGDEIAECFQGKEWNRTENEGLFCSICMDAWTNEGDHHICCLPCGHIYGLSCISKWLRRTNSAKCPQCNAKCSVKDVRKLFAPRIAAVDNESQKIIRSLEVKCAELQKNEAELKLKVKQLTKDSVSTKGARPVLEKLKNFHDGLDLSFLTGLDTFNSSMIPSGEAFTSIIASTMPSHDLLDKLNDFLDGFDINFLTGIDTCNGRVIPSPRETCTSSTNSGTMPSCESVILAKKSLSECLGLELNSVNYIQISSLKSALSVLSSSDQSGESREVLSSLATKVSDYRDVFHSWISEFVDVANQVLPYTKNAHELWRIGDETEAYERKQKTVQNLENQIAKYRAEMEAIEYKRVQFGVEQSRALEDFRIRGARLESQRDELEVCSNRMSELRARATSIMTAWFDLRSIVLSSLDLDF